MNSNSTVDRRSQILLQLSEVGRISVSRLSEQFQVSEVTIRNDLARLEQKGLLIKTRGGAIRNERVGIDPELTEKQRQHYEEKKLIGKKVIEFISDGDTIILDSGTTTIEIAKNLEVFSDLTVITNGVNIAGYLSKLKNIKVIMPGGFLRHSSLSLVGVYAEQNLRNFFCDKLFLGVDGIECKYGLFTPNLEEAHINRVMIDISKEVFVVTDSSKFLRRSFAFIAPVEKIHTLVTDSGIPEEEKNLLKEMGKKVVVV
jgi:DeoR family transcriptional regulator of aga operon